MNMVDRRRYKRKFVDSQSSQAREDADRQDAERKRAEAEAARQAEKARVRAEQAERAAAEARARSEADALAKAEAARQQVLVQRRRAEAARAAEIASQEADRIAEEERRAAQAAAAQRQHAMEEQQLREEARRKQAEAQAEKERHAAELTAQKARAEAAKRAAKLEAQRKADEARKRAEEDARAEAQRRADAARHAAEREAQRKADEARKRAEEDARAEAQRRADAARHAAEREAQRKADEARKRAEEAASIQRPSSAAKPKLAPLTLDTPIVPPRQPLASNQNLWLGLNEFAVSEAHLGRNRIITAARDDPAHTAFDVLRTRLLQALSEKGWKRVAITSPTKDCGKTFTAANLAISLSRQENFRTLLMDCDMRRPTLHSVMGAPTPGAIGDMLRGTTPPEQALLRLGANNFHAGHNIAFGFNNMIEPYASELLQDPRTEDVLDDIEDRLDPDVMLFDLPPALYYDDVIAFRPMFDGVLLVVGGGITTEKEIKEVERRLGETTPLLGVVLNKAENTAINRYRY